MAPNDRLYLILHPAEGEAAAFPWRQLTEVIEAIEIAVGDAAQVAVSRRHPGSDAKIGPVTALLAGPPENGSLVIPLVFECLALADALRGAIGAEMDRGPLGAAIGHAADVAAILTFARDLVFGERGTIARRSGLEIPPPKTAYDQAVDTLAPLSVDRLERLTINLMEAAERTGCAQVEVQVNDQSRISLLVERRRRSSYMFGQYQSSHRRNWAHGSETIIRADDQQIRVEFEGQEAMAFLGLLPLPAHVDNKVEPGVVVVWKSERPLPAPRERILAKGEMVDRSALRALDDIPTEWKQRVTEGVVVVRQSMASQEWQ